jgi:hypothetical protein
MAGMIRVRGMMAVTQSNDGTSPPVTQAHGHRFSRVRLCRVSAIRYPDCPQLPTRFSAGIVARG